MNARSVCPSVRPSVCLPVCRPRLDPCASELSARSVFLPVFQTRAITIQDVHAIRSGTQSGAAKAFDFSVEGGQALLQGCSSSGGSLVYVATQGFRTNLNVLLNFRGNGGGAVEPHQRWATGLLVDNVYLPSGSINFINRGCACAAPQTLALKTLNAHHKDPRARLPAGSMDVIIRRCACLSLRCGFCRG
jgi:hypothetical protein